MAWAPWIDEIEERQMEPGASFSLTTIVEMLTARDGHDDQELLLGPNAQLTGRASLGRCMRATDLGDHARSHRVPDVDDKDARMRVSPGPVRPTSDVGVAVVQGEAGIHATLAQRRMANEHKLAERSRARLTVIAKHENGARDGKCNNPGRESTEDDDGVAAPGTKRCQRRGSLPG